MRSHLGAESAATAAAKQAEEERVAAAAAAMDVDGPDGVDEREQEAIQDDEGLVDENEAWTRAGDNVEDDIDEVAGASPLSLSLSVLPLCGKLGD